MAAASHFMCNWWENFEVFSLVKTKIVYFLSLINGNISLARIHTHIHTHTFSSLSKTPSVMVFDDLWKCNFTKKDLYFISKLQILSFHNRKCVLAHVVSTETCLQLLIKWTWWHNFLLGTSKYFWMHLFILKELLAYFYPLSLLILYFFIECFTK